MAVSKDVEVLTSKDIDSLVMFALYQIKDIPEYSTLSRMAYLVDRNSFLNLCEYFGGITVRIPTVQEVEEVTQALLLYQFIDVDGLDMKKAVSKLALTGNDIRKLKSNYVRLKGVLSKYDTHSPSRT